MSLEGKDNKFALRFGQEKLDPLRVKAHTKIENHDLRYSQEQEPDNTFHHPLPDAWQLTALRKQQAPDIAAQRF